jgi:hypothetical protein
MVRTRRPGPGRTPLAARLPAHEHAGETAGHGVRVGDLDETGPLEDGARADVGHREIDLLAVVLDRVALDGRSPLREGVLHRPAQQSVHDPLPAVTGAHPQAPGGPHRQLVDVRDLRRAGEGQLSTRCDRRPAHDDVPVVGQHARRDLPRAQRPHVLGAGRPDELPVQPGVDAVTEAPADRRLGPLRSQHGPDVVEALERRRDGHRSPSSNRISRGPSGEGLTTRRGQITRAGPRSGTVPSTLRRRLAGSRTAPRRVATDESCAMGGRDLHVHVVVDTARTSLG